MCRSSEVSPAIQKTDVPKTYLLTSITVTCVNNVQGCKWGRGGYINIEPDGRSGPPPILSWAFWSSRNSLVAVRSETFFSSSSTRCRSKPFSCANKYFFVTGSRISCTFLSISLLISKLFCTKGWKRESPPHLAQKVRCKFTMYRYRWGGGGLVPTT